MKITRVTVSIFGKIQQIDFTDLYTEQIKAQLAEICSTYHVIQVKEYSLIETRATL